MQNIRQYIRNIVALAALWITSLGAWAQGGQVVIIKQLNGTAVSTSSPGAVESSVSGGICTLTVTPASGNYLISISAVRTVEGSYGQGRTREVPAVDEGTITMTPSAENPTDKSKTATYTLTMPESPYDVEVTANFGTRTSIEGATITLEQEEFTYDGTAKEPAVTAVTLAGGASLTVGTDYIIEYSNNIDVPDPEEDNSPEPTVTVTGISSYTGTATKTFSISSAGMNVTAENTEVKYDGKPHGITVTVTDDKGASIEGVTIKYGEEEEVYDLDVSPTQTDAGTKTVYYEVTKKGYVTIEGSCDIIITKADGSVTFASNSVQKTFGDAAFTNEATNTGDGRLVYSSGNEEVAKVDPISGEVTILAAGSTVIEARVKEAKNYQYTQEMYAYNLEVAAKANGSLTVTVTGTYTYNGKEQIPALTVKDGEKTLNSETDYDISYGETGNVNAGEVTVTVTGKGNYAGSTGTATFTIAKAAGAISFTETTIEKTFGDQPFINELTKTGDGTVSYHSGNGEVASADAMTGEVTILKNGEATITATVADGANYTYETKTASYNLIVGTANIEVTANGYTGTYDKKPHGITVTVENVEEATIKYGEEDGEYTLTESPTLMDAGEKTVYYEVSKTGYTTVIGNQKIIIEKAEGTVTYASKSVQKTFGDAAFTNEATNTGDGRLVYSSGNEEVAKVDPISGEVTILAAGSTVIEARVKEAKNYQYTQEMYAYNLEVAAKANGSLTVTVTGTYTYNGKEQIPALTVKDGEKTLNSETDYDISYGETGNVNAGEVTVTVTGKGNYAGSTGTATFTITPAKATITAEAMTVDYDKKVHAYDKALIKVTATPEVNIEEDIMVLYFDEDPSQLQEDDKDPVDIGAPIEPGIYYVLIALNNDNYDADAIVTTLTIEKKKAEAGLSFSQSSVEVMLNAEFEAPTLNNPNKLTVTWESSKTDVATVDQNGNVTIMGVGSTTISAIFAGNDDYLEQTASYTISVSKQDSQKYDIWVGGTQVTSDNQDDIFGTGDAEEKIASSFSYNPKNNTLIVGGYESDQTIEVKNPAGLTLYLGPNTHNKLGKIIYTGDGDAPLLISTDGNNQGYLDLDATTTGGYVIEGFSVLNIDYLAILSPEGIEYQNKRLATQTASIGQVIQPLTEETTVTPNDEDFKETNEEGETEDVDLTNTAIEDILYTLNDTSNPEGDGYDDEEHCIVINSITTNEEAAKIVEEEKVPGTQEYAESFNGLTFMVPSGEGVIKIDVQTLNGYVMMVKIGSNEPISVTEEDRDVVEIPYNVEDPTYVYIYNAGKNGNGGSARSTISRDKKTKAHVKVFSVSITPSKVTSANNVKDVSGGAYTGDVDGLAGQEVMGDPDDPISTAISEILNANVSKNTGKWYNLNGQQVTTPQQKGLYIRNGKKVYVK